MRSYAKLAPTFWTGSTGRVIRRKGPEAVIVALYLMSAPGSTMLGLYYQPVQHMAHETGLGVEGARKGLEGCIEAGFCRYDESTEMVWVVEMAAFQIAKELKACDKRCAGVQSDYEGLPENPFLGEFFDRYQGVFHLSNKRGCKGASKPLPSQEQEQEQEHDQAQKHERASLDRSASPADGSSKDLLGDDQDASAELTQSRSVRLAAVTADAIDAYNRILGRPHGLLTAVRATVGKDTRRQQVRRCLKTASEICLDQFGTSRVTTEFWNAYFTAAAADDFCAGRGPYRELHSNWRPDFEYLTRRETMLKLFDRAVDGDKAGEPA